MKKYCWFLLLAVFLIVASCGPKPATQEQKTTPEISTPRNRFPNPTDLTAQVFHRRINLSWKTNRDDSTIILGYNIYLWNENSHAAAGDTLFTKVTEQPYAGDVSGNITFESYPLDHLENGVIYRAYVTTVFPGGTESKPTNIVEAIPRPEGAFTLNESFKGPQSGYSLKKLESVPTDDLDNDIYLALIDRRIFVASPRRLDSVYRESKFYILGIFSELDKVHLNALSSPPANTLEAFPGAVFVMETQEGAYALMKFESVNRAENKVRIAYKFQPRVKTLKFD
jgi:hypothetical protein